MHRNVAKLLPHALPHLQCSLISTILLMSLTKSHAPFAAPDMVPVRMLVGCQQNPHTDVGRTLAHTLAMQRGVAGLPGLAPLPRARTSQYRRIQAIAC